MIPKVGIVSYKNVAPLRFGLQQLDASGSIKLIQDYPAALADQLFNGELDVALVPVAFLKSNPSFKIIGKHCIATNKTVASVCLFSQVPLNEIETIILDYQSRSSVQLVQILCRELWHINPQFINASKDYISNIKGKSAGVIIGDRAFEQANHFPFIYDLGEAWFALTQLPFVFAVWASKNDYTASFINQFNTANELGLSRIAEIAQELNYPYYNLQTYFTENIVYNFDEAKSKAVELFLSKIA